MGSGFPGNSLWASLSKGLPQRACITDKIGHLGEARAASLPAPLEKAANALHALPITSSSEHELLNTPGVHSPGRDANAERRNSVAQTQVGHGNAPASCSGFILSALFLTPLVLPAELADREKTNTWPGRLGRFKQEQEQGGAWFAGGKTEANMLQLGLTVKHRAAGRALASQLGAQAHPLSCCRLPMRPSLGLSPVSHLTAHPQSHNFIFWHLGSLPFSWAPTMSTYSRPVWPQGKMGWLKYIHKAR